jgi:hypothetical protein
MASTSAVDVHTPLRGPVRRPPFDLGHASAAHHERVGAELRIAVRHVCSGRQVREDGGAHAARTDLPPPHDVVHRMSRVDVLVIPSDLDLVTDQVLRRVHHQGTGVATDVDHHGIRHGRCHSAGTSNPLWGTPR